MLYTNPDAPRAQSTPPDAGTGTLAGADVWSEQKPADQSSQTEVGQPHVSDRQRLAMDRMAEESRKHLIPYAEDHHHAKPPEVHVRVRRSVDHPCRVHGHRQTQSDPRDEPEQAGADECFGESVHYLDSRPRAVTGHGRRRICPLRPWWHRRRHA